jgi:outer membrane protein assembly factor BamB
VYAGGIDGSVHAVDVEDGSERWVFETEDAIQASPAVLNDTVYVGSTDGSMYAIDVETGYEDWRVTLDREVRAAPHVHDGSVNIGDSAGTVYSLAVSDGSTNWTFNTGSAVQTPVAVNNGTGYVGTGDGDLYAVNMSDGSEKWVFDDSVAGITAPPIIGYNRVYAASENGTVYGISTEKSYPRKDWQFNAKTSVVGAPALGLDSNRIYIPDTGGRVTAVDTKTGDEAWSFTGPDTVAAAITLGSRCLYTAYSDGKGTHMLALLDTIAADGSDGSESVGEEAVTMTTGFEVLGGPVVTSDKIFAGTAGGVIAASNSF